MGFISTADAHESRTTVIYISGVCRHWRHAALACHTLWQCVAFSTTSNSSMECATHFLDLSGVSPLFLYASGNLLSTSQGSRPISATALHLFQMISINTSRLYACHLFAPPSQLCGFWGSPAPSLRYLFVYGGGKDGDRRMSTENMSNLQTLWLVDCGMPTLNSHQNLTTLVLRNYCSRRPSLRHFLRSLNGLPRLRHLTLHRFFGFPAGHSSQQCVALTHLRTLRLEFCETSLILNHLDLPPAIAMSIIHDRFSPSDHILSCLPQGSGGSSIPWESRYIEITLFTSHREYSVFTNDRTGTRTSLQVPVSQFMRRDAWLFESLNAVVSFPQFLSVCSLKLRTDVRRVPWSTWFSRLPELTHLDVDCTDWVSLFNALMMKGPDRGQSLCTTVTSLSLEMGPAATEINRAHLLKCICYLVRVTPPLKRISLYTESWDLLREDPLLVALIHSSGKFS